MACGILSGNRHFEGRLCNCVRANYLASPPLVVAYALAGTMAIDFEEERLGEEKAGLKPLLLGLELIFSNSGFCFRHIQVKRSVFG